MTATDELSHLLKPRSRTLPWVVIASVLTFFVAAGLIAHGITAGNAAARRQEQVERARTQQKAAVLVPSRTEQEDSKRWQALAVERNFSWAGVLAAVEHAIDPDVELLEFRPDKLQHSLTLRGEAKSIDAVLRYLDMLAAEKTLKRVYLMRANDKAHGNLITVEFEIHASTRD